MWFGQTGLNVNRFETGLSTSVNGAYDTPVHTLVHTVCADLCTDVCTDVFCISARRLHSHIDEDTFTVRLTIDNIWTMI